MKEKILSIITALIMFVMPAQYAFAQETAEKESAQVTDVIFKEDFSEFGASSQQNSLLSIGEAADNVFMLKRTSQTEENSEKIVLDNAIENDIVELEFKILPRETAGEKSEAYIQLMQGTSNARLNIKISCDNGEVNNFRIKVGSKEVIANNELYHLPKNQQDDAENFTKENFNTIKMIMHRVNVDGVCDKDLSNFYVYLNGNLKGTYTFTEIGSGGIGYTADKKIESIRMYQYPYDTGAPLDEAIYLDDITVKGKSIVEYVPAELSMNFNAAMNYEADSPKIVVSNGTDNIFLEQSYKLQLVSAENADNVTELAYASAVKAENSTAVFSFEKEVTVEPGWYYARVERYIEDAVKGDYKEQKIYVASSEQLSELPEDFSDLPQADDDAEELVKYYLPCFLAEEEIMELLPEEDGTLTQLAKSNLDFITTYFKNVSKEFVTIPEVHNEFLKAKSYLGLKNSQTQNEVRTVLENGGYLAAYLSNEVFIANEEAFFSHFETKRTDDENPLISDEKINAALRFSMALTSLNVAERSEIENIVNEYNDDVFGLNLTKVTEENKDTLFPALYNKGYVNTDAILLDWNEAVTALPETPEKLPELEEEESGSGRYPSGGGGGGGGGSFTTKKNKDELILPEIEPTEVVETVAEKKLTDLENHWAQKEITALFEKGIVTGFEDDSFRPDKTLTRAEAVVILSRILTEIEETSNVEFSDVDERDWFFDAVRKMSGAGVVQGYDNKFMPYDCITREQLAVIIYRALNTTEESKQVTFMDSSEIAPYAVNAIGYLYEKGLLSGYEDNTVRPKNYISRAEAAKLLYGLLGELTKE